MNKTKFTYLWPLFVALFACVQSVGQTNTICFDIDDIQGVVFLKGGDEGLGQLVAKKIPVGVEEVLSVDSLVKYFINNRSSEGGLPQQGYGGCPVISKSWNDYQRQVIKYEDKESSTQILWIQYIHKQVLDDHPNWKENWVLVSGGCSNYWQIRYDVKSKKLFDFSIN